MGLNGRLLARSSFNMELNESPEGSIITCEKVSSYPQCAKAAASSTTFDTDCMENRFPHSPSSMLRRRPSSMHRPKSLPSALASSGM